MQRISLLNNVQPLYVEVENRKSKGVHPSLKFYKGRDMSKIFRNAKQTKQIQPLCTIVIEKFLLHSAWQRCIFAQMLKLLH